MRKLLRKEEVKIPIGCEVTLNDKVMTFKGKRDTIVRDLTTFNLYFSVENNKVIVRLWNGDSREQSKVKTAASIIKNAVTGCMSGFRYSLKVVSKHFPMSVELEENGKTVVIKGFLGEKNKRVFKLRGSSFAKVSEDKTIFSIEGSSLEDVSQSAGTIQENCQVKKTDTRRFLDGVYITNREVVEGN